MPARQDYDVGSVESVATYEAYAAFAAWEGVNFDALLVERSGGWWRGA